MAHVTLQHSSADEEQGVGLVTPRSELLLPEGNPHEAPRPTNGGKGELTVLSVQPEGAEHHTYDLTINNLSYKVTL